MSKKENETQLIETKEEENKEKDKKNKDKKTSSSSSSNDEEKPKKKKNFLLKSVGALGHGIVKGTKAVGHGVSAVGHGVVNVFKSSSSNSSVPFKVPFTNISSPIRYTICSIKFVING